MIIIQLLGFLFVFIGGFLAGKEYGTTATTAKMGDEIIKAIQQGGQTANVYH